MVSLTLASFEFLFAAVLDTNTSYFSHWTLIGLYILSANHHIGRAKILSPLDKPLNRYKNCSMMRYSTFLNNIIYGYLPYFAVFVLKQIKYVHFIQFYLTNLILGM